MSDAPPKKNMKTFEETYKKCGLRPPVFLKSDFRKAEESFASFCKELESRNRKWEEIRSNILREWGGDVPTLSDLEEFDKDFDFSTWSEAIAVIGERKSRMLNDSLHEIEVLVIGKKRQQWIEELVNKAPIGTRLIVIRDQSFQPKEEFIKTFSQRIAEGKEMRICRKFTEVIWVAFKPESDIGLESIWWGINKSTSTVEYII